MTQKKSLKHPPINYSQCKIIFFDLEYYVPEANRSSALHTLSYNPQKEDNKLLGGSFYCVSTIEASKIGMELEKDKMISFWLWNSKTERDLVKDIYNYLCGTETTMRKKVKGAFSPLLCGIGIAHSDWPVLLDLFCKYQLTTLSERFELQNRFRTLDLQVLAIPLFNSKNDFVYPKIKNDIFSKCLKGTTIPDGRNVWNLFENQEYGSIEDRTLKEIHFTVEAYRVLRERFTEFRSLYTKELNARKEIKKKVENEKKQS
jgi:hypothetical protein